MLEFKKYQHVERIGRSSTEGITNGTCYIFPKLDGTNGSVWFDGEKICCGSRKRHLDGEADNQGFKEYILKNDKICNFLKANPNLRLYGEFLVPHTYREYIDEAWKKFYVFDVIDESRSRGEHPYYLPYYEYAKLLNDAGIEYIPPIEIIRDPSIDQLLSLINYSTFLTKGGKGEGIVVKNYNFVNRYGRIVWGKIVSDEFKASHGTKFKSMPKVQHYTTEHEFVDKCLTKSMVDKVIAKIENELEDRGFEGRDISRLLNTVYHDLVTEELWDFVKKGNKTINFKNLMKACFAKTKEYANI